MRLELISYKNSSVLVDFGAQTVILTCIGEIISYDFGILPYSVTQYVTGAFILFVSAEVLEVTLASVISDCAITLIGYHRQDMLLNATMFPTLIICILAVVSTLWTYNSLKGSVGLAVST
uniref:Uncharacterized protein n=1 Tax=Physcomitrium patens TaxID=3218 RepID=A0A2K1K431_PHYPA|nr:hypothetical protein PHYPA_013011 [Physcomitrium patens]